MWWNWGVTYTLEPAAQVATGRYLLDCWPGKRNGSSLDLNDTELHSLLNCVTLTLPIKAKCVLGGPWLWD